MLKDPVRKATLITGIVLTVLGALLLLWMKGFVDNLVRWWPAAFVAFGAYFLYRAWFCKGRPASLFVGLLMFLTGAFILAVNNLAAPALGLTELWPVFMGIVGVSLIPYGSRYRRTIRVGLVIPGIILIVLMAVFLLFSLSIVKESFADFVISWWPLVLVFMGITLVASAWAGKKE
jgi:hypothetical protein